MVFFRKCAAAVLFALAVFAYSPASAQTASPVVQNYAGAEVSLTYFEQVLAPFGRWLQHPVWGEVWQPDSGATFRPYFYGYWQYTTDYGWLWVSNEPYGDIVYHYGRWVFDPNDGWLWVPGYIWGPGWVAWRDTGSDGGYIGWLPLPPGYQDFSLNATAPSSLSDDWYGYRNFYGNNFASDAFAGLWVFVPAQDFGVRNRRPYVIDRARLRDLYRASHDRTDYDRDREHDRIVNRSIDKDALEQSTHRSFGAQQSGQFLRHAVPIVPPSRGEELSRRNGAARAGFAGRAPAQGFSLPGPANDRFPTDRDRRETGIFPRGTNPPALGAGARPADNQSTDFSGLARAPRSLTEAPKIAPRTVPGEIVPGALRNRARLGGVISQSAPPSVISAPGRTGGAIPVLPQARLVQPSLSQHGPAAPQPRSPAVTPPQPVHSDAQPSRNGVRP